MSPIVKLGLAVLALAGFIAPASAQDYPNRAVKIIVPFGAGGPADIYARFIGQHLQETLKQSFVVENRPGAGAVIGTGEVAKSAPDGYTLLMMSNTHTTNETLLANRPYQLMRDFVPVAPVNASDLIMVVHPSVAAKDLKGGREAIITSLPPVAVGSPDKTREPLAPRDQRPAHRRPVLEGEVTHHVQHQ